MLVHWLPTQSHLDKCLFFLKMCFYTPWLMMTNDCFETLMIPFQPLLSGHQPTIFARWNEENLNVFLRCT